MRVSKVKSVPTKRAPDVWESARFTSIFLASGFFYISSIVHVRPHAGNANRWALSCKTKVNMKVKRASLFFIVVAVIGVSMFVFSSLNRPTPAELLKAEQEVYSAILQDTRNFYSIEINKFQVVEYTSPKELKGYFPEDSADYSVDFREIPDLKKETWKDYQEKNKVSHLIKNYLPFTADVILVDPSSVGISSGTNDKQFYWWVSLSRIGFDSSLTQALVLVGDCMGESCFGNSNVSMYSQGYFMFLKKENEKWIIQNQQRNWLIEVPSP